MKPTKVIFSVNGSEHICYTEKQLESFLSSGWYLAEESKPKIEKPKPKIKK